MSRNQFQKLPHGPTERMRVTKLAPALGCVGLALMPSLTTIAVFQVIRRAGDYAIARPTREVLFTVLAREDRYKAKSFIDTFVYRLGDQFGAWGVGGLQWLGTSAAQLALVAIPVAFLWLLNALWLGRRQEKMAETSTAASNPITG